VPPRYFYRHKRGIPLLGSREHGRVVDTKSKHGRVVVVTADPALAQLIRLVLNEAIAPDARADDGELEAFYSYYNDDGDPTFSAVNALAKFRGVKFSATRGSPRGWWWWDRSRYGWLLSGDQLIATVDTDDLAAQIVELLELRRRPWLSSPAS
jgi:hypothetical protein